MIEAVSFEPSQSLSHRMLCAKERVREITSNYSVDLCDLARRVESVVWPRRRTRTVTAALVESKERRRSSGVALRRGRYRQITANCRADGTGVEAIPATLRQSLMARLDRLREGPLYASRRQALGRSQRGASGPNSKLPTINAVPGMRRAFHACVAGPQRSLWLILQCRSLVSRSVMQNGTAKSEDYVPHGDRVVLFFTGATIGELS